MSRQVTLIEKFWRHVTENPLGTAVAVINPDAGKVIGYAHTTTSFAGGTEKIEPQFLQIDWANAGFAVARMMAYLRQNGVKRGDCVALLSWNSPEWVWADFAIQSLGAVTVPIYPNNGPDQVNYILKDCGASLCFVADAEQAAKVSSAKAVNFADIAPELNPAEAKVLPYHHHFVHRPKFALSDNSVCWGHVTKEMATISKELAQKSDRFCHNHTDDLATLIYTSGSTGDPKGCMITHGNIAAALNSLSSFGFAQNPKTDFYLSYLPLAHVLERIDGMGMAIWHGVTVGFCTVEAVRNEGALEKFSPTLLAGVPAVWRGIKEKADAEMAKATGLKAAIAKWAMKQKSPGIKRWLADQLVFKKIRAKLGGRLRLMISGGAPISKDVLDFYETVGLNLLQGYGLTETSGGITTNRLAFMAKPGEPVNKVGAVGQIVPGNEGYINPEPGDESGQGEIWLRGPLVFKGYWKRPEDTAKTFTEDGWFKTGDLGLVDEDQFLFITGRKKRLLKTDGGKYVAPEKIEKAFEPYPIVHYMVPVGDNMKFISGLIFVNQALARKLVSTPAPAGSNEAVYLAEQPEVQKAVADAVTAANGSLERWEQLKKFAIVPVEARVDNGMLTPTLKVKSESVVKQFKTMVDAFYK